MFYSSGQLRDLLSVESGVAGLNESESSMKKVMAVVGVVGLGAAAALADGAPDASSIVTTASTTFDTVGALVASAVGFFIIVKIVKWIRK